ncbi:DUF5710 domain-containing protein [Amycolatopsis sp. H20-H5]|uniref:DUF5710 domain-containing protein n=1 Tax=Amycolatopsis sp. H20-H5 TaxID=3046309 RepID=UPI002DB574F0|nr:DUF5710 domain-containing protein [Amycolatopsis sp. H20-H5]MEC3974104.1 DUF5710 domain-containing protein [Amycolatopsis sp. H20-H5]
MGGERGWLDVPYSDKDEAKALGARWDPRAKRWYAPGSRGKDLQRWAALPEVPDLLPGEDRAFGSGLFVDLVPRSCWFTNVRSCVDQRDWERLRRMVIRRAGGRCEVCGREEAREEHRWLEVHERWAYDAANLVQSLRRLICLCTDCHQVTHLGLAQVNGLLEQALSHLMTVTGLPESTVEDHVHAAFARWEERSRSFWTLDLAMLTDAGVTITGAPAAAERDLLSRIDALVDGEQPG